MRDLPAKQSMKENPYSARDTNVTIDEGESSECAIYYRENRMKVNPQSQDRLV